MHRPQVRRGLALGEIRITETFGPLRHASRMGAGDRTSYPSPRVSGPIAAWNSHDLLRDSPAVSLGAMTDERQGMELRSERPTAAIDEERVGRRQCIDPKQGEGDHPSDGRGPHGARHRADLVLAPEDGIAMDRRRIALDSEAEELPPDLADVRP